MGEVYRQLGPPITRTQLLAKIEAERTLDSVAPHVVPQRSLQFGAAVITPERAVRHVLHLPEQPPDRPDSVNSRVANGSAVA
eukprot:CAMPEP_0113532902 /NCGR_PEP_ID=MMETSP0015_2-20120614/4311_1 /TAXON_ID=2838 /ORGANISM="Odontella" /LENGTH=81 /DNA_ID=CAMNT_0000431903 /DNA_START=197 /DNA_END=438 /DNA_ORIENTATION=- /assembly_acc=CAM_ASM_000160